MSMWHHALPERVAHRPLHFIAAVGDALFLGIESNTVILPVMNVLNHCRSATTRYTT